MRYHNLEKYPMTYPCEKPTSVIAALHRKAFNKDARSPEESLNLFNEYRARTHLLKKEA